jgi:hypothetical protein
MHLSAEDAQRFCRIWFPLLHYVNNQRGLGVALPAALGEGTIVPASLIPVRAALWDDDGLRERFVEENPAGLPAADLAIVASWQHRISGKFFIFRHLNKHTVFLSETMPVHAYGVLGLVSPLEDVVGPYLPI